MSLLHQVPLWGYFVVLGVAFVSGHLLAYRPDPAMGRGRRLAGRWGSSLLLLVGLLLVSNRVLGTVLPAVLLALIGGVLSGRSAPVPPTRSQPGVAQERPDAEDGGRAEAEDRPGAGGSGRGSAVNGSGGRAAGDETRQARTGDEAPPDDRR